MKIQRITIVAILFSMLILGCTERIDVELNTPDQQRLVVEGWITDQFQQHEVRLTLTTSYFYNQPPPPATGALVQISDGESTWTLNELEPGYYYTPELAGESGRTYALSISYDGVDYAAQSYMREVAPIDSMKMTFVDPLEEFGFEADPWYEVRVWTEELEGVGDAYMWLTWVNGESLRDTLRTRSIVDDSPYDGNYISNIAVDILSIPDEAATGDTVYLEQWNIGYEAYTILNGILNETVFNGGLFDAPPANVETNISNGALGYFGAASVASKTAIIYE